MPEVTTKPNVEHNNLDNSVAFGVPWIQKEMSWDGVMAETWICLLNIMDEEITY